VIGPRERVTGSWWRLLLVAFAACAALVAACGDKPQAAVAGTVEFGTGGSGCTVQGPASSFPSGTGAGAIYDVAHFSREVSTGEVVTFRVLQDGKELAAVPRAFADAGDCLGGALPAGLPAAHYRIEYLAGTELLAAGEFDIGP
jgi:hypothetical protein